MANKKISELQSRTPALSDLMLVGDPSSGYSYKCTVTALATIIETDIADGYVTIGTTQTISGAKTFSNNLTLTSVVNTPTDPDKFLTLNASNVVTYRTGAEVLSDIGGASASSISGTTNYVAKFTSSSAIGNSAIYSNTSGNVSIGNTNDAYKLDVSGTVRSTSNFVVNNGTVVGNYAIETAQVQIGTFSNHPFVLTTFNTERVRIDTSGNVTFSQIANATTDTDKFLVSDSGVLKYRTGAEVLSDIGAASSSSISGTTNYLAKFTSSSAVGNSQIFDNGTNVGIGTNTPSRTLDVNGIITTNNNLELTSANPTILWTTSNLRFYNNTNGVVATISSAGQLSLSSIPNATTDTDKFLVSDGGVVKYRTGSEVLSDIGAASSSSISGTTNYIPKFTSSSAIGNSMVTDDGTTVAVNGVSTVYFKVKASTNSGIDLLQESSGTGYLWNRDNAGILFGTNNSERMRLDASGNLYLNTTSGTGRLVIAQSNATQPAITLTTDESTIQGPSANTKILMGGNLSMYGANILTFGTGTTERARIDASGNLGLGTSSPDASYMATISSNTDYKGLLITGSGHQLLQVQSTTSARQAILALKNGGQQYSLLLDTDNALKIYDNTSAATRLTLSTSGNLGLGVSPSAWGSLFKAYQNSAGSIWGYSTTDAGFVQNAYNNNSNWIYINSSAASLYQQATGQHIWYQAGSGVAGNPITFTQAMTLDASGNLLVGGTSSTGERLQITGTGKFTGNVTLNSRLLYSGTRVANINSDGSTLYIGENGVSNILNVDLVNQRVGIGTTSPAYKITTSGGSSEGAIGIERTTVGTNTVIGALNFTNNNAGTVYGRVRGGRNAAGDGYVSLGTGVGDNLYALEGGNVGISTSSPAYKLDINGGFADGTNNYIATFHSSTGSTGDAYIGIGAYRSDALGAGRNAYINAVAPSGGSGNLLLQTTAGNVGIGTTSPAAKLQVNGSGANSIFESGAASDARIELKYNTSRVGIIGWDVDNVSLFADTGDYLKFGTNNTERMRITSGGLVGIGTTNPAEILELSTTTDPKIRFVDVGNLDAKVGIVGSTALGFEVNGSERMRITSGGELLINTTSDAGDYKLQVNGNSYITGNSVSQYAHIRDISNTNDYTVSFRNNAGTQVAYVGITSASGPTVYSNSNGHYFAQSIEANGSIKTAAPSGGTAKPWKLGQAGVTLGGSNTSGIAVEIDGTVYYLVTGYLP